MKYSLSLLILCSLTLLNVACNSNKESTKTTKTEETATPSAPAMPLPENPDSLTPEQFENFVTQVEAELKELDQAEMQDILEGAIAEMQAQLPADITESMMISYVQLSEEAVSYIILCDEAAVNMDDFENAPEKEKEELNSMMDINADNPENALFATICKVAGKDIKYIFVGSDSGKQYDITFKNEDL